MTFCGLVVGEHYTFWVWIVFEVFFERARTFVYILLCLQNKSYLKSRTFSALLYYLNTSVDQHPSSKRVVLFVNDPAILSPIMHAADVPLK